MLINLHNKGRNEILNAVIQGENRDLIEQFH